MKTLLQTIYNNLYDPADLELSDDPALPVYAVEELEIDEIIAIDCIPDLPNECSYHLSDN